MRQLKNLMKAKKPMWRCGECKCVTLQCWRENDEFCNCGTSSEGLGVEYSFKDWNGTVLKQGSIDEGATPTPPADPTREATAEYTYTFAGWDPEVGPINEDTVYTATYTATVNQYTVSIASNDIRMGTVDVSSITVDYGTEVSSNDNILTIGSNTITATAEEGYIFSSRGEVPTTVTGDLAITATFEVVMPAMHTVTFSLTNRVWDENAGEEGAFVPAASQDPLWGTISSQSVQVPDGFTFSSNMYYLTFYSPDGSPSDDDAVVVNITPDKTISQYMSWDFGDEISEISGIEIGDEDTVVIGDVSGFPIIFFDDNPEEPGR